LNVICSIYLPLQDKLQGIQFFFGPSRIVNIRLPHILRLSENCRKILVSAGSITRMWSAVDDCSEQQNPLSPVLVQPGTEKWLLTVTCLSLQNHPRVPRVSRMWLIIIAKANSSWGLSEQAMTFVFCNTPVCFIFVTHARIRTLLISFHWFRVLISIRFWSRSMKQRGIDYNKNDRKRERRNDFV